jgi:hypothetical protein
MWPEETAGQRHRRFWMYVYPALDSPSYPWASARARENYRRDVKHETVHLIQFLAGLDNLPDLWPDVWFSEGMAVSLSDN